MFGRFDKETCREIAQCEQMIDLYEMCSYEPHLRCISYSFVTLTCLGVFGLLSGGVVFWCALIMAGYFGYHLWGVRNNREDFCTNNALYMNFSGTPREIYSQYWHRLTEIRVNN